MRTRGQRVRIRATIRSTSATAPAEASMLERRSLAERRWRPQNTVSERDSEHALGDERRHVVLDQVRPARIHEAACKAPNQADDAVGRPEQKRAGIGGDRPAVETRLHPSALNRCKIK